MNHPYWGLDFVFATMHKKDKILAPSFREQLKATLQAPKNLNTDQFGTFSGEITRPSNIKAVLREKALLGTKLTGLRQGLASEGTFGPHPWIPFVQSNRETLLFVDLDREIEIFVDHVSTKNQGDRKSVV